MKIVKNMTVSNIITQDDIIEELLYKVQTSYNKKLKPRFHEDKIYLNKTTMTIILKYLGNIIETYMTKFVLNGYNHKVIIEPFPWLRLYIFDQPDKKTINNLTGKEYTRKGRRRFKAYISQYHQRQWNNL